MPLCSAARAPSEYRLTHSLYDIATLAPLVDRAAALLTPNSRLARRMVAEWGAAQRATGITVWEPLDAHPLEAWLRARWSEAVARDLLPPRAVLSPLQEYQVWQQVIATHTARTGAIPLLRIGEAAELAAEARQRLLRWELDPAEPRTRQLFKLESDCAVFLDWLEQFESRLAADELYTPDDCLVALASLHDYPRAQPVALVECEELAPLEARCLERVAARVERLPAPTHSADCRLLAFKDRRSELDGVARWAAALHREQPEATIGIVLAATGQDRVGLEYLLRREFDCLGDDYASLPVNFSTGISLSEAPVVRDAFSALALGKDRVSIASVSRLLRSRYLQLDDADSTLVQDFKLRLLDNGNDTIDVAELRGFAGGLLHGDGQRLALGGKLLALHEHRELRNAALPSRWAVHFHAVLDLWGWPGAAALDSLEYQQVALWYATLESLGALDGICGEIDYAGAVALLREACDRQASHPQTADSPVQVLGPLEAVGLSFDHLWLLGMQATAWPAPARPNPFLPVSLQAARGMPHATAAREWAFGSTLLAQYRRANRHVFASYAAEVDGVAEHPSALLDGFVSLGDDAQPPIPAEWLAEQGGARLESVGDSAAPPPGDPELAALRGGAALLQNQSLCPFRAFAAHRLHAEALPEAQPGLSPAERGKLVHEALQYLWRVLGDHAALEALDTASEQSLIAAACDDALRRLRGFRRRALGPACLELEASRLRSLLAEWLEVERQRADFSIAALEEDVVVHISRLAVRLRVDRIDTLPGGAHVIIDYKTGTTRLSNWLGERPSEPQMLLYGLATEEPPAALAFAQVRPGDCLYRGLGEVEGIAGVQTDIGKAVGERMAATDWAALNAEWAATLARLTEDFLAGTAGVDPKESAACRYCGLQPLCRIGEEEPDD